VVFQFVYKGLVGFNTTGQKCAFLENGGGIFGVVPEALAGNDGFQLVEPDLFGSQVKGSLRAG